MAEFEFDCLYARRESEGVQGPIQFVRQWLVVRALREALEPGSRILEVGCGMGDLALALTRRGYRVDACDLSVVAVRKARRRAGAAGGPSFFVADGASLRAPGRYDAVVCLEVLEHVPDDAGLVRNLAASLKPGGRLICSVPHSMELWSLSDEIMGHLRRYTREELRALLESAGLSVERVFTWGYPLLKVYADWRRSTARRVDGYSDSGKGIEMLAPRGVWLAFYRRFAFLLKSAFLVDVWFLDRGRGIGLVGLARRAAAWPSSRGAC